MLQPRRTSPFRARTLAVLLLVGVVAAASSVVVGASSPPLFFPRDGNPAPVDNGDNGAPLLATNTDGPSPSGGPGPTEQPEVPPVAPNPVPPLRCHLMSTFAIFVQVMLACFALSALVYKRHREHPPRPWKIWALDTSKQVVGQTIMHTSNLVLSWIFGHASLEESNPCVWYFVNFMLDTTLGVGIVWLYLKMATRGLQSLGVKDLKSGEYGPGPKPDIRIWFKQLLVFSGVLISMKVTVVLMTAYMPIWVEIGGWFLSWVPGERAQVVVVMFIAPVIMNIVQVGNLDSFGKRERERRATGRERKGWHRPPPRSSVSSHCSLSPIDF